MKIDNFTIILLFFHIPSKFVHDLVIALYVYGYVFLFVFLLLFFIMRSLCRFYSGFMLSETKLISFFFCFFSPEFWKRRMPVKQITSNS